MLFNRSSDYFNFLRRSQTIMRKIAIPCFSLEENLKNEVKKFLLFAHHAMFFWLGPLLDGE